MTDKTKGICPPSAWPGLIEEKDPNGIDQHEAGAKLDAGKPRCALVLGEFANALLAVSRVGTFGANKYTPKGWLEVPNAIERYEDAAMRHMLAHFRGEEIDPDSGEPHLSHATWCLLAVQELKERDK